MTTLINAYFMPCCGFLIPPGEEAVATRDFFQCVNFVYNTPDPDAGPHKSAEELPAPFLEE
jgi:hypothetical protein